MLTRSGGDSVNDRKTSVKLIDEAVGSMDRADAAGRVGLQ